MIRFLTLSFIVFGLVACGEKKANDGQDVTPQFLETMVGTYSAKNSQKATVDLIPDSFSLNSDGVYVFSQFWFLEYPYETCVLRNKEAKCKVETKGTYCRVIDTGRIGRVTELFIDEEAAAPAKETHRIEGLRKSSVYDDDNEYVSPENEQITLSGQLACRKMVQDRNRRLGSQLSEFSVIWPDENTLKFNHVTIPGSGGLGSLDETGTFIKE